MNKIITLVLKQFIPTNFIEMLKGKKRATGILILVLWLLIYQLPLVCVMPWCVMITGIALSCSEFLTILGISDYGLLSTGTAITLVGLLDWISQYILTDAATKVIAPIQKITAKSARVAGGTIIKLTNKK